jgi:hypothetical protein
VALEIPIDKMRARAMAHSLMVQEIYVRSRIESGAPLTAQERLDGIRITHDDYLYLVRLAMAELKRQIED